MRTNSSLKFYFFILTPREVLKDKTRSTDATGTALSGRSKSCIHQGEVYVMCKLILYWYGLFIRNFVSTQQT